MLDCVDSCFVCVKKSIGVGSHSTEILPLVHPRLVSMAASSSWELYPRHQVIRMRVCSYLSAPETTERAHLAPVQGFDYF